MTGRARFQGKPEDIVDLDAAEPEPEPELEPEPEHPWKPRANELKVLRGMIIDRKWWRGDRDRAKIIRRAIRKGIESLDHDTFWDLYHYLWGSGLPGTYETRGFDEEQMEVAWRIFRRRWRRRQRELRKALAERQITTDATD
jgi:hypothetical protein